MKNHLRYQIWFYSNKHVFTSCLSHATICGVRVSLGPRNVSIRNRHWESWKNRGQIVNTQTKTRKLEIQQKQSRVTPQSQNQVKSHDISQKQVTSITSLTKTNHINHKNKSHQITHKNKSVHKQVATNNITHIHCNSSFIQSTKQRTSFTVGNISWCLLSLSTTLHQCYTRM